MQVRDVMTQPASVINPNMSIRDAARQMRGDNIGALPVGENDRLIGVVTDRDIVVRAVAAELAAGNTTVSESYRGRRSREEPSLRSSGWQGYRICDPWAPPRSTQTAPVRFRPLMHLRTPSHYRTAVAELQRLEGVRSRAATVRRHKLLAAVHEFELKNILLRPNAKASRRHSASPRSSNRGGAARVVGRVGVDPAPRGPKVVEPRRPPFR